MADEAAVAAQLIQLYEAADSNLYWTSCALALLIYDYLLTLKHEVRFVWSRKFSAATVLFLLNRYVILLLYLVDVGTLFPIIPTTCPGVGRFITVLEVIPYVIWAAFSSLRVYALSGRILAIGVTVLLLSLVPAGVNAYFFSTFTFVNLDPPSNCTALSDISAQLSKTLTIVSRASLIAADVLVIAVTWVSTYRVGKAAREARLGTSFGMLLLRDGTIYFVVLLAMNVVHMTLNTVKPNNAVQQASYVTVLENPITSILISRFILNLRAVDHRGPTPDGIADDTLYYGADSEATPSFVRHGGSGRRLNSGRRENVSSMRFATSFVDVDTLGAPLEYGLASPSMSGGGDDGGAEGWAGEQWEMDVDVEKAPGPLAEGARLQEAEDTARVRSPTRTSAAEAPQPPVLHAAGGSAV